jgi:hypothetical protein
VCVCVGARRVHVCASSRGTRVCEHASAEATAAVLLLAGKDDCERGARAVLKEAAPARNDIPAWLDGRHHTARARRCGGIPGHGGEHTRRSRMTATLARRPATTKVRDKEALTYGLRNQKVKAAVKKSLVRRRGCSPRQYRKQRRHGVEVRGFSASRGSTGGLRLPRWRGCRSLG